MRYLIYLSILFTVAPTASELTDYQKAYILSVSLENKVQYGEAVKALEVVYYRYSDDYEINLRLGWLNYLKQNYRISTAFLEHAVKLKAGSIEAKTMILLPLLYLKKWDQLEKYAKIVIKHSPSNYYANIRLAYAYYLKREYQKSIERYQALYTYYPGDINIRLGLASTYMKLKNKVKARSLYSSILRIYPYHYNAYSGYLQTMK